MPVFVLLGCVGCRGVSRPNRSDASSTVTRTVRTNRAEAAAEAKAAEEAVAPLLLRGQLLLPDEHDGGGGGRAHRLAARGDRAGRALAPRRGTVARVGRVAAGAGGIGVCRAELEDDGQAAVGGGVELVELEAGAEGALELLVRLAVVVPAGHLPQVVLLAAVGRGVAVCNVDECE